MNLSKNDAQHVIEQAVQRLHPEVRVTKIVEEFSRDVFLVTLEVSCSNELVEVTHERLVDAYDFGSGQFKPGDDRLLLGVLGPAVDRLIPHIDEVLEGSVLDSNNLTKAVEMHDANGYKPSLRLRKRKEFSSIELMTVIVSEGGKLLDAASMQGHTLDTNAKQGKRSVIYLRGGQLCEATCYRVVIIEGQEAVEVGLRMLERKEVLGA